MDKTIDFNDIKFKIILNTIRTVYDKSLGKQENQFSKEENK